MRQALIEAMRFDIEGNFCDALLDKIGGDGKEDTPASPSSAPLAANLINSDIICLSCRHGYHSYIRFCKNGAESYVTGYIHNFELTSSYCLLTILSFCSVYNYTYYI